MGRGTCLEWLLPLGKSSAFLGMSVSDLWLGIVSCKSHVSELKYRIPKHSKKEKTSRVLGESSELVKTLTGLRSQGGVAVTWGHGQKKMHRRPVSHMGVLLPVFLNLFKVIKINTLIFDLFKVSKIITIWLVQSQQNSNHLRSSHLKEQPSKKRNC